MLSTRYFIDRNPRNMHIILDFLRSYPVDCDDFNEKQMRSLQEDLDFFLIRGFPVWNEYAMLYFWGGGGGVGWKSYQDFGGADILT